MAERAWIVGVRVSPDDDLYTYYCIVYGVDLIPVMRDGSILLASNFDSIGHIIELADRELTLNSFAQKDVEDACDIAMVLYLITSENWDEQRIVICTINTLTDLVEATSGQIPDALRPPLYRFADHMTFSNDLNEFFEESEFTRNQILNAIYWCTGWVMTHSMILSDPLSGDHFNSSDASTHN